MTNIQILRIKPEDNSMLQQISDIAKAVAIPADFNTFSQDEQKVWADKGFLVSGYPLEKYQEWSATEGGIYAVLKGDRIISFLTAYGQSDPPGEFDKESQFIRTELSNDAVIIKQIGVHPDFQGQGYARILYEHLENVSKSDIYLVIMVEPRNIKSEAFHQRMGYSKIADFNHPSGSKMAIWLKPWQH